MAIIFLNILKKSTSTQDAEVQATPESATEESISSGPAATQPPCIILESSPGSGMEETAGMRLSKDEGSRKRGESEDNKFI